MSLKRKEMSELLELLDNVDAAQARKIQLRLVELAPPGTDNVKVAIKAFDALDAETLDVYHFFKEIRAQFNDEDWEELLNV